VLWHQKALSGFSASDRSTDLLAGAQVLAVSIRRVAVSLLTGVVFCVFDGRMLCGWLQGLDRCKADQSYWRCVRELLVL